MALVLADRVKQESTTTGTGAISFSGGVDGFQSFSAVCSTNDTLYYVIQDKIGTNFEIGHGTFNGSGQLERTNVLQSSNSDSAVNFGAGTKDVFITYPADKAVFQNYDGSITIPSTIDGRDLATDGSKLDGIEASATADQTASEIRTLVESASDSNVFTDADHTKLNGIEASATADQSNAEIRTAVEAATDSNVFTDADHTKLNGIEASATADQTGAEIKSAYEGESDTNALTDTLLSKLNGIEASATADQTNAEIRTAVEAASDSNVFTDADHTKLNGIEASADVTDTANVTSAGALMDSEVSDLASVKAINQGLSSTSSPTFADVVISSATPDLEIIDSDAGSTAKMIFQQVGGASMLKTYSGSNDGEFYITGGATSTNHFKVNSSGNITVSGTVDGRDLATDGTKLDGIASGAEVNVQSDWNAGSGDAQILNKPTIPSNNNQLTNGAGFVTSSGVTSVATGNGLSGGTITSTGTLTMSGSYTGSFSATGNITAYSSDVRLKDFKGPIENALDKVNKLSGHYYEWNDTAKNIDAEAFKEGLEVGVIAQEVEQVMPEVVCTAPIVDIHNLDTDYKTVHYDKLVPLLIEAIKELKNEIEKIKTKKLCQCKD